MPELDGVRGIAVLMVMLCHSRIIQDMPQGVLRQLHLQALLFLGWSGVDLFFVLSGFLITGILLDSQTSKNYFSSFYARRILRIVPLYVTSVFGYFHVVLPLVHKLGYMRSLTDEMEKWFWFHLSNWPKAFGAEMGWLQHFWSLAIEEQFYLFWPFVVFFAGRRRLAYVCFALIAVSFGLRCAYANNHYGKLFLYTLTPFRLEPLVFGSLAAILVRTRRKLSLIRSGLFLSGVAIGGVIVLLAVLLKGRSTSYSTLPMATYGYTAFAIIYVSVVLYAYVHSGSSNWLASLLRTRWLRAFGKYSYAIYVFHFPLFRVYGPVVRRVSAVLPEQLRTAFWLVAVLAGIALSYAVGLLSWNLIEKHFWGLKSRFAVQY